MFGGGIYAFLKFIGWCLPGGGGDRTLCGWIALGATAAILPVESTKPREIEIPDVSAIANGCYYYRIVMQVPVGGTSEKIRLSTLEPVSVMFELLVMARDLVLAAMK
jgi:hypothetical protein